MSNPKRVAFYMSAQTIDRSYAEPSLELVRTVVRHGYTFVYGGSDYGLMKEAADEVTKLKGKISAVSSKEFEKVLRVGCDEHYIANDIPARIAYFIEHSDALIALPGGSGTLDEITTTIEGRKLGLHQKPIIFFNINGFWSGIIEQYRRMEQDGFLSKKPDDLFFVSDDIEEIITSLHHNL